MPRTTTQTTTQRGYGTTHQQQRAQWQPIIDTGQAQCTEPKCLKPNRWINPQEPWDLAHNRDTGQYRGPAHEQCNRAEGATWGNTLRGTTPKTTRWIL